jgi:hypothetical protein
VSAPNGNGGGAEVAKVPVNVTAPIQAWDEVWRLAANLATAALLPRDLHGKPADVAAMILYGQDLGLSPMQAIQGIYIVEGRPSLSAQLWLALVRRAGHRVSVEEHTSNSCTVYIKRGDTGEDHKVTYTINDAIASGLVSLREGKPYARSQQGKALPWELHTKSMLLARAVSTCCRFIAPEIALGFYSPDEVEEIGERVEAERLDVTSVAEQDGRRPEDVAADVDAIEAEFVVDESIPGAPGEANYTCGVCGERGHYTDECTVTCNVCGEDGHAGNYCPTKGLNGGLA